MTIPIQAQIEQFDLPHPSGEGNFRISVARHPQYADGMKDVPVLFVLDADMGFALAAEIARVRGTGGMTPTAMVVGIGYGADSFDAFVKLRTADLTPPLSDAGKQAQEKLTGFIGEAQGGADALLDFLVDTLKPEILARYPEASTSDHTLYGHSLGGLFTAYALLTRPDAFANFVPSSPSLWWDGFAIMKRFDAFPGKLNIIDPQPQVFVCVGGKEQELPTKAPPGFNMSLEEIQALVAGSRMIDTAAEFAEGLKQAGLKSVSYVAFDDEDHTTVLAVGMMRTLAITVPHNL